MNRMLRIPILSLAAIVAVVSAASAATGAAPDSIPITPAFRADALKIVELTHADSLGAQMGGLVARQSVESLKKNFPDMPDSVGAIVQDEVMRTFGENAPKLRDLIVMIYARHFTDEDLRGMIAFYATPIGARMIREMPTIMQESMVAGQVWAEQIGPTLSTRIQNRLAKPALPRTKS